MRKCLCVLLFVCALCLIGVSTERAAEAFSVSVAPAHLSLKPGEKHVGFLTATNSGDQPAYLKAYVGDWRKVENGIQYLAPGDLPRGLSRWMQVNPSRLTVLPGGAEKVYYGITMPEDPALAGSYWGMVFVEEIPPEAERLPEESRAPTMAVTTIVRYAVMVYVTIPGTEIRQATFTGTNLNPRENGLEISATFENQGNIYLRPYVWLELHDQTGMTIYSATHQQRTVLPDSKRDYTFELRELNLPPGRYMALIIADYDAPNLIAAQAEIEIKPAPPAKGGSK